MNRYDIVVKYCWKYLRKEFSYYNLDREERAQELAVVFFENRDIRYKYFAGEKKEAAALFKKKIRQSLKKYSKTGTPVFDYRSKERENKKVERADVLIEYEALVTPPNSFNYLALKDIMEAEDLMFGLYFLRYGAKETAKAYNKKENTVRQKYSRMIKKYQKKLSQN